jgi:hypothetical protein
MASPKKIRVMISSRCMDTILFKGKQASLSEVQKALKADLENQPLLGSALFEVWINEDAPPAPGTRDSWETCMQQIRDADVVLVLYNGVSGWAERSGDIGICHGELQAALAEAPGKVRLIELPLAKSSPANRDRDTRFQRLAQTLFRGAKAENGEQAIAVVKQALRESVADLACLGVREASRGRFYAGAALDWSRLDYEGRRRAIVEVISNSLRKSGAKRVDDRTLQKNVTESQANNLLGFPDATIVSAPFGVYVADNVQKIQMVLIKECRDETATNLGLQRFMTWLEQTGEGALLVLRAKGRAPGRAQIVKAIAAVR